MRKQYLFFFHSAIIPNNRLNDLEAILLGLGMFSIVWISLSYKKDIGCYLLSVRK